MTTRRELSQEVQSRLLPRLLEIGFYQVTLTPSELASDEIKEAFPFGRLHRASNHHLHVVEIQFDRKERAAFVLNFGVVPQEGVVLPWAKLQAQDAPVSALSSAFRLYSNASLQTWFGGAWSSKFRKDRAKAAVDAAIAALPELESWYSEGRLGKHMKPFGFKPPAKTAAS